MADKTITINLKGTSLDELKNNIASKQPLLTSTNAGDNITITGTGNDVKINTTSSGSGGTFKTGEQLNTIDLWNSTYQYGASETSVPTTSWLSTNYQTKIQLNNNDFTLDTSTTPPTVKLRAPSVLANFANASVDTTNKQISQILEYTLEQGKNYRITFHYGSYQDGNLSIDSVITYTNAFAFNTDIGLRPVIMSFTLPYNIKVFIDYNNNAGGTPSVEIITDYSDAPEGVAIRFISGVSLLQDFRNVPIEI